MPRRTFAAMLWDEVKALALPAVHEAVDGRLDDLQEVLVQTKATLSARADVLTAAGVGLATRASALEANALTFAPKQHTHPVADINGLAAATQAINNRLTALETAVAAIKVRLGLP